MTRAPSAAPRPPRCRLEPGALRPDPTQKGSEVTAPGDDQPAAGRPQASANGVAPAASAVVTELLRSNLLVTDPTGAITRWDAGAEIVFGWRAEEVAGRPVLETLIPAAGLTGEAVEGWRRFFEGRARDQPPPRIEVTARHFEGHEFPAELWFVPVPLSHSLEFNFFIKDVTSDLSPAGKLLRLEGQHRPVVDAIAATVSEGTGYGDLLAGMIVAFRPLADAPWVEEALRAREAALAPPEEVDPLAALPEEAVRMLAEARALAEEAQKEAAAVRRHNHAEEERRAAADAAEAMRLTAGMREDAEDIRTAREEQRVTRERLMAVTDVAERMQARLEELQGQVATERGELAGEVQRRWDRLSEESVARDAASAGRLDDAMVATRADLDALRADAAGTRERLEALARNAEEAIERAARAAAATPVAADVPAAGLDPRVEPLAAELEAVRAGATQAVEEARETAAAAVATVEKAAEEARTQALQAARDTAESRDALAVLSREVEQAREAVSTALEEAEIARGEAAELRRAADESRRLAEEALRGAAEARSDAEQARAVAEEARTGAAEARQAAHAAEARAERARRDSLDAPFPSPLVAPAPAGAPMEASRNRAPAVARPMRDPHAPLREGFDDVPVPMAMISPDGYFRALNPSFSEKVGWDEAEFRDAVWPSVADRRNLAAHRELMAAMLAGELDEATIETCYVHAEGLLVPLTGRLSVERDEQGEVHHLLFTHEEVREASATAEALASDGVSDA